MHVYWSAGLEAHALGAAASAAAFPSERKALLELQALELRRKEAARRLLADVWRLEIAGTSEGTVQAA
jgi:hypothetical protein